MPRLWPPSRSVAKPDRRFSRICFEVCVGCVPAAELTGMRLLVAQTMAVSCRWEPETIGSPANFCPSPFASPPRSVLKRGFLLSRVSSLRRCSRRAFASRACPTKKKKTCVALLSAARSRRDSIPPLWARASAQRVLPHAPLVSLK